MSTDPDWQAAFFAAFRVSDEACHVAFQLSIAVIEGETDPEQTRRAAAHARLFRDLFIAETDALHQVHANSPHREPDGSSTERNER